MADRLEYVIDINYDDDTISQLQDYLAKADKEGYKPVEWWLSTPLLRVVYEKVTNDYPGTNYVTEYRLLGVKYKGIGPGEIDAILKLKEK